MGGLSDDVWDELLYAIEDKKCTPFIGPGASSQWIPLKDISREWAEKYKYPFKDPNDISKVSQYLAILIGDKFFPQKRLRAEIQKITPPPFKLEKFRNTSPKVLADLNLPLYITTNYDQFLEAALESQGKAPITEFCRWNEALKILVKKAGIPSIFDKRNKISLKEETPIVYHLHGVVEPLQSMVLTERDLINFVINMNIEEIQSYLIPPIISQELSTNTLLFIGYGIEDFRVIFQSVIDILTSRDEEEKRIAVLPPSGFSEERKRQAQEYLERYTKKMFKIDVYWGNALEFVAELRERLEEFRSKK